MHRLMSAVLFAIAVPLHAATYVIEPHHTQGVVRWSHLADSPGDLPGVGLIFDGLAATTVS